MPYISSRDFINSYRTTISSIPAKYKIIVFIFFVSLIELLPVYSTAQPLAEGKNKFLGCSMRIPIRSNFANYWNQVTPDDAGKWGSVEAGQDQYNWANLDNIYNYAIAHGFPYKHHCLIWGNQQPAFMAGNNLDSASKREEIRKWIDTVGKRYPNMSFIDVVNEPFMGPPDGLDGRANYKNALGGNGSTGWDWVITAFQWARQYCAPGVKLVLNEYNVLHDNARTTNYIRLIDTLKVRGLIDAVGIQGHYFEFKSYEGGSPSYTHSISTIKSNLDRLAATELPIYITEFDINEADDNTQLQNYQTYFPIFWEHPAVKGITLWGYVQYDIWKTDAYLLTERYVERPAMQWLRNYIASPMRPALISPVGTVDETITPLLVWHSSDSATSYRVQISDKSNFSSVIIDSTVADTLLQLDTLDSNTKFYWHVNASNEKGTSEYSTAASFTTGDESTGIDVTGKIPARFVLSQNYPNPFNPKTVISYQLSVISDVKLSVYDVLGREIAVLINNRQNAGIHTTQWNAQNFPSGIYFCRLQARPIRQKTGGQAGNFVDTKKIVLMK